MSDPFRSELEAAHARIEKLEDDHKARVAELERENDRLRKRLVDAAPPSHSKTGKTFFAIAMMTLGVSLVGGMFFARIARPPRPAPILELPVEVAAPMTEIDEQQQAADPGDFDRATLVNALSGVRLGECSTVHRSGHVNVTIAPSGLVTEAKVDKLPLGTAEETKCVESHFRAVHIPPFTGPARRVGKSFSI
jgi:hypothetical protein